MNIGKTIRLERIVNRETGRTIIVPMDHGVTMGAVGGLINMREAVSDVVAGGADAVLLHKGLVGCAHRGSGQDVGLIVHLSASTSLTPNGNTKALVATVEEGIRLGADCISVHVNLGDPEEGRMLADFGRVSDLCERWGMPLLAMLYARGPKISNPFDGDVVAHCARVGAELGADIVKVPYTGTIESFRKVTEACCVPVVIAGGEKVDSTRRLLEIVHDSLQAGGSGLSVGRNVFQHPRRKQLVRALRSIVHEGSSVEEAMAIVGE
ncbi:MAG: 2-amino-3,7-dideoxy-D-threo-hept-6-ulosonate synthase [Desulfovibrionaceae bacterium]|nr:2-amino-3,7-dideoxy-D-threo-hept-6-ulosonate synthase [Desulfovibrionaceae bacterium]